MNNFKMDKEGIFRKKENVDIYKKLEPKMKKLYNDANYTTSEKDLFSNSYFGNLGFKKINDYLRTGKDDFHNGIKVSDIAEKINNKILKTKTYQDVMLFRGISNLSLSDVDNLKVGKILKDKGILSTSLNPERAYEVSQTATFFNNKPVMLEIKANKGSNMLISSKIFDKVRLQEYEVVLPSNAKLEITGIKKYKYVTIIKCKYLKK